MTTKPLVGVEGKLAGDNSFQSAYIKHHSTETTLLSVHDHIIKAMNHQQVTCFTLLDFLLLSLASNLIY